MKRHIREATLADIPALDQLVAEYYAEQHDSGDDASLLAQSAAEQMETCIKESSHCVYVVEHHARERGCVRLMLNNRRASTAYQRGFYPRAGFHERDHFANFVKKLAT
jgi:hypothetical protein